MTFKDWLIMEGPASDTGSDFFYGLSLYPTDAFDYVYAVQHPADLQLLKNRWKTEKSQGRPFYGIDTDKFQKIKFLNVISRHAPDGEYNFWKHKPDNNLGDLEVEIVDKLDLRGYGHTSKSIPSKTIYTKPLPHLDLHTLFGD